MRFLIDTHCWLWLQTEPGRFGSEILQTLGQPETARYFSAASAWEIAIKHALGKLPLPEPPATYVPERMRISRTQGLAITHAHALGVGALPHHHRDPFDRLLVAQARIEALTLITVDPVFAGYEVSTLHPQGN